MKKLILLMCMSGLYGGLLSQNFTYQLYLDQNANCTYDSGEPLIYNTPAWPQLLYLNGSSNVTIGTHSAYCGMGGIPLNNPASPPTNTFVLNPQSYYPGFIPSTSCNVWQNNPYGSTVYFPVTSANPVSQTMIFSSLGADTVHGTNKIVQVCNTNDTVDILFSVQNLFSCNTGATPRTYSLYLDGTYFEHFTTTGLPYQNTNVNGVNSFGSLKEAYGTYNNYIQIKTALPTAFATLGSHTLTLKSTPIYGSALSALDESWLLTSVGCSNFSGNFFIDCNTNCVKDAGDQSPGAAVIGYVSNGSFSTSFMADANGNFSLLLPSTGNYTMSTSATFSSISSCSSPSVVFPGSTPVSTLSFGFNSTALFDPNVSVTRNSGGTTNPGNTIRYMVCTSSLFNFACSGSNTGGGPLKVVLPPLMSYSGTSSSPAPTIISASTGDTLIWNVTSFTTVVCRTFSVTISSTISLQTPFTVKAYIYPTNDINANNNISVASGTVGAPHDPNNKLVWSSKMAPNGDFPVNETLKYTINFQNIGTAPAVNVVTIDTLDNNLDIASVRVLGSSFPVQLQIDHTSRQMTFKFNNINLAPQILDDAGSQGYVQYEVKLKSGVPYNTVIYNRAFNYFDYTDPVATNQTSNKLVNFTSLLEAGQAADLLLMPNPFAGKLTVSATRKMSNVVVVNQLGQLCLYQAAADRSVEVDLSSQPAGIYFVNVAFDDGSRSTRKVIKE